MKQVHGQRTGLDVDAAKLLGLAKGVFPAGLTRGPEGLDGQPAILAGLGSEAMLVGDTVGPEGV
jgi:hypothetical protein